MKLSRCPNTTMASRSFKPASYLASAAGPNRSPGGHVRPSFTRTSSASSNFSTKSDDSLTHTLKGLSTASTEKTSGGEVDGENSSVNNTPSAPQTPGRKGSQPIAIELPSRGPKAYTPLSARGDLIGGYFPNHEDSMLINKPYQPHPFHHSSFAKSSAPIDSPIMSASSSLHPSPSESTPKMLGTVYTPAGSIPGPVSPTMPEALLIPMGKYHPSNYKPPALTLTSTPTSTTSAPRSDGLPPSSLAIPPTSSKRGSKERPGHERKTSDVKRKLQQYQRDMIVQARLAASSSTGQQLHGRTEPISPRLLPAGSPGPITPFELDMESDGYIVAGHRARRASLIGNEVEKEKRLQGSIDKEAERASTMRV